MLIFALLLAPLLLFPVGIMAIAYGAACWKPALMSWLARFVFFAIVGCCAYTFATAMSYETLWKPADQAAPTSPHRAANFVYVTATYFGLPFITGYLLRGKKVAAVIQFALYLAHIATLNFAGFTGYLRQTPVPIPEETNNRFIVLHMIVAPTILTLFLIQLAWKLFGGRTPRPSGLQPEPRPQENAPRNATNPYDAPGFSQPGVCLDADR